MDHASRSAPGQAFEQARRPGRVQGGEVGVALGQGGIPLQRLVAAHVEPGHPGPQVLSPAAGVGARDEHRLP